MDMIKIGKFIAMRRKEKELTQLELATALKVTDRAVSKWENGRSLPDTSIMLDLCKCLGITIIDLRNGEIVNDNITSKEVEETIYMLTKEKEDTDRLLLRCEFLFGIPLTIFCFLMIPFCAINENINSTFKIVIIISSLLLIALFIAFAIRIEQKAGYYECPHCKTRYVPSYKNVLMSMHINRTRYMKCPHCNKK